MMSAFEHMGSGGGQGLTSDIENMLQMVQAVATEALRTQSAIAIGRLHQVGREGGRNLISSLPITDRVELELVQLHTILA
jgi:hypothetical protein